MIKYIKNKTNMVVGGAMLSPKNIFPRDLIDEKNHKWVGGNTGNLIIGEFGRKPICAKANKVSYFFEKSFLYDTKEKYKKEIQLQRLWRHIKTFRF